ncbi:AMP-binding protein [Flavitalea sp. BT771]|uniref:AMP-binding protein n=1 Tax=Flavitalea sp. BT771 TaxID=3063329 RepID=UPI0026E368E3|nr:AMP-binding protein [Flavitalea sp. BT771]MDO6435718.1 AMP-binding protein [Flavitalea sp. BT771]MDV6224629.1 AMP-binding protein [Flavitalea sp. BT771]
MNIIEAFRRSVRNYPDKTAVKDGQGAITYEELESRSDQLAQLIASRNYGSGFAVGIYLSKSINTIVGMLAVLKAGGAYLPVNIEYPFDRIKFMLNEAEVRLVLTEKMFIHEVSNLQWQCPSLEAYLCLDSEAAGDTPDATGLKEDGFWESLINEVDGRSGGWIDAYTGAYISGADVEAYGEHVLQLLMPFVDVEKEVLEIGCCTSLSMHKVAPFTKHYTGAHSSIAIIRRNKRLNAEAKAGNISYTHSETGLTDGLEGKKYDIVILNGIACGFRSPAAFVRELHRIMGLLNDGGIVFIGDLPALNENIDRPETPAGLRFAKDFFRDLMAEFHNLTYIDIRERSPLTPDAAERFDVILHVGGKRGDSGKDAGFSRTKHQFGADILSLFPSTCPDAGITPDSVANIIFTSGSTGRPKGVLNLHKGLVRATADLGYLGICSSDVWLQTCNIAFDASGFEIFGALLNGCTLCLISAEDLFNNERFGKYLARHGVSVAAIVAPLFHEHASVRPTVFASLKKLMIGGDTLSPALADQVRISCPELDIYNVYGPTENSIMTTYFKIQAALPAIPIGKAVPGCQVYIVDDSRKTLPAGVAGELCITGDGLALGYLHDPVLTATKFINGAFHNGMRMYLTGDRARMNFDGNIEFLGRKDQQVKIRGNRVELHEIEEQLKQMQEVENAVVVLKGQQEEDKRICAYLKLSGPARLEVIRQELSKRIPYYMMPSHFIILDAFPLTTNNKIDRNNLPDPEFVTIDRKTAYKGPVNEIQRTVAGLWGQVLETGLIGMDDNFFDIGGNSLKLIKLFNKMNEVFPDVFQIATLFDHPTVQGQVDIIMREEMKMDTSSEYTVIDY